MRLLGQISFKPCVHSRGYSFASILMKSGLEHDLYHKSQFMTIYVTTIFLSLLKFRH